MVSPIDSFLIWWLHTGRYSWSWMRRRLFERGYLKIALPEVHSLAEIEACLKQVTWTMDGPLHMYDCISYPQVTWVKKKDDCDGFASLAAALISKLSPEYKPVLLTTMVHPVRASHTVCVFASPDGSLCFFDNDRLRCEDCHTYSDIPAKILSNARRLVCWDVRNPATLDKIEFHRT